MVKTGKCKYCGRKFTNKMYEDASNGVMNMVGDYDDVCYPCQFKHETKI